MVVLHKKQHEMNSALPFMSEDLQEFVTKFPDAGESIRKFVRELTKSGKWDTVMSDFAYKPGSKFPRNITIKHVCRKGRTREKYVQGLTCTWKDE